MLASKDLHPREMEMETKHDINLAGGAGQGGFFDSPACCLGSKPEAEFLWVVLVFWDVRKEIRCPTEPERKSSP